MTSAATAQHTDTVQNAAATPDHPQPYRELGLKDDEYARIREILGRRPTDAELAMYSVMWSEHCSYKSSKVHLAYFGETTTDEMRKRMLAGIGENAGVVDIGDGWAVTFKVESHNHPSYVEPYQGAATGVGGIVRDIMAMGARPVAVIDPLRFGPADAADTRRVLPGVVAGVGGYGNSLGLPNIGGEVVFDESYAGNPLVNALCIGAMRTEDLHLAFASGTGNKIILFGARTGLDGIGGVSVLASETFAGDDESATGRKKLPVRAGRRPVHREGADRVLPRALPRRPGGRHPGPRRRRTVLRHVRAGQRRRRRHAHRPGHGAAARHRHDARPRSSPASRRSACARSCTRENVDAFMAVCRKWDVLATVIGEVTDGDRLVIDWHGETVRGRAAAHRRPRRAGLPAAGAALRPARTRCSRRRPGPLRRPTAPDELARGDPADGREPRTCAAAAGSPTSTTATSAATPPRPSPPTPASSASTRRRGRGVAVATDCNGRYIALDPYAGAQLALAEAYRNVATTGAAPLAVTDCLNFGSPEDPDVMWQFQQAVHGLADGCAQLGIPVTGGNVSFYNQTGERAILPTPVVGVLGVIDDVRRRIRPGSRASGDTLLLLGDTRDEFDGSEWADVVHGHLGGRPPAGRPRGRAAPRRGPARRLPRTDRAAQRRARPVRRRSGAGAGRDVPGRRPGCRRRAAVGPRPVRRAVLRVGGTRARDRRPRAG